MSWVQVTVSGSVAEDMTELWQVKVQLLAFPDHRVAPYSPTSDFGGSVPPLSGVGARQVPQRESQLRTSQPSGPPQSYRPQQQQQLRQQQLQQQQLHPQQQQGLEPLRQLASNEHVQGFANDAADALVDAAVGAVFSEDGFDPEALGNQLTEHLSVFSRIFQYLFLLPAGDLADAGLDAGADALAAKLEQQGKAGQAAAALAQNKQLRKGLFGQVKGLIGL